MIDIHAHILPGLDDGPSAMEECLGMARAAIGDGIHTIIATPHSLSGLYVNQRRDILSACGELNAALKKQGLPMTILPGSEIHLSTEITDELENGRLMTLNDTGRYISLELPDQFIPEATTVFVKRLSHDNVTPIISHPERNHAIQQNPRLLGALVSAGALSQITAGSLLGAFGPHALKCCRRLIQANMIHFMASDAHSVRTRPPELSTGFRKLSSLMGRDAVDRIMFEFPRAVVEGGRIIQNIVDTGD